MRGSAVHPSPPADLESLWAAQDLQPVEALMLEVCTGRAFDRMSIVTAEHLSAGGKRLRARLALGATVGLGGSTAVAVPWAAACELLHNATLLHDDVQDGDPVRRGRPASWVRHGVAQAVNAGDLLLMLPYAVLEHLAVGDDVRWRLVRILARNAERIVRGQATELDLLAQEALDWDSYASAAEGKTAALFGLPVEGAALLAGRAPDQASDLARPFRQLGVLFQIQDDVLDLYGDKGRDLIGADLYEGKISALVSEHLRLHPDDRPWLVDLLRAPRVETDPTQVRRAIDAFAEGGALAAVWARMDALRAQVQASPALEAEPRLSAVAGALVAHAMAPIAHCTPS